MGNEQAEDQEVSTILDDGQGIDDILNEALRDKADDPENVGQAEESEPEGQSEGESEVEETKPEENVSELFGELVLEGEKKLPFKTEDEFHKFLEMNPMLRDGFLRQSDYTRKTTLVSEDRKKLETERADFEKQKQEQDEFWGSVKPDDTSMSFMRDFWTVFQHGSPQLAQRINAFANDIQLISNGRQPVGPLAQGDGQSGVADPHIIDLRRQIDQMRTEGAREKKAREADEQRAAKAKVEAELDSWISEKGKQGVRIQQDEFKAMALFANVKDTEGRPLTWDAMYKLAMAHLGRTDREAIKKVYQDGKRKSAKAPIVPNSKTPANAQPEPEDIGDILEQGAKALAEA